jgi:hypothetical protein
MRRASHALVDDIENGNASLSFGDPDAEGARMEEGLAGTEFLGDLRIPKSEVLPEIATGASGKGV